MSLHDTGMYIDETQNHDPRVCGVLEYLRCQRWSVLCIAVLCTALLACGVEKNAIVSAECAAPAPIGCSCVDGRPVCSQSGGGVRQPIATGGVLPAGGTLSTGGVRQTGGILSTGGRQVTGGVRSATGGAESDASISPLDAGVWELDSGSSNGAVGFVGEHGALAVQGNQVVDRDGRPVQLRGMSWFWSQWTDFYVAQNVDVMVDDWRSTVVRAALGVENEGGYLQDPVANVAKVRALVDRAIERGVYVIIDWHDHHAQQHTGQATAFFEEMVQAYGDQPHVIFEIYNEPVDVSWSEVKSFAETMIRTIRTAGSSNLIIVGTPNWSQDVDIAATAPITSDDNVAYTLHFYADTHKQSLRDKAQVALDRGIALFVTEWGTCSADGNGSVNAAETQSWLAFLRDHSISWANWSLHNKPEACSAVQNWANSVGPWPDDQLTPSGRLVKDAIP